MFTNPCDFAGHSHLYIGGFSHAHVRDLYLSNGSYRGGIYHRLGLCAHGAHGRSLQNLQDGRTTLRGIKEQPYKSQRLDE